MSRRFVVVIVCRELILNDDDEMNALDVDVKNNMKDRSRSKIWMLLIALMLLR